MDSTRLLAVGLLTVSLSISSHLFAQEDVVQKRKAFMNDNYDAWKAIKRAVEQKDYGTVGLKAKDIMGNMDKVLDHFPKSSITGKSRAKAEIWEKWDEFSKHPAKVKKAAQEVADAAKAKNEAEVSVKLKALGDACGSCHRGFRGPRKSS